MTKNQYNIFVSKGYSDSSVVWGKDNNRGYQIYGGVSDKDLLTDKFMFDYYEAKDLKDKVDGKPLVEKIEIAE